MSRYELAVTERKPVGAKFRGFTLGPATGVEMVLTEQRESRKSLQTVAFS